MTRLNSVGFQSGPAALLSRPRQGVKVIALHDALWRIVRDSGDVLGYIELFETELGAKYRAKRMLPLERRFIVRGEFWQFEAAIDCLRFG